MSADKIKCSSPTSEDRRAHTRGVGGVIAELLDCCSPRCSASLRGSMRDADAERARRFLADSGYVEIRGPAVRATPGPEPNDGHELGRMLRALGTLEGPHIRIVRTPSSVWALGTSLIELEVTAPALLRLAQARGWLLADVTHPPGHGRWCCRAEHLVEAITHFEALEHERKETA